MKNRKKLIKSKESTFTLRIDQFTMNSMDAFSKLYQMSKSKLARKSIRAYIALNVENRDAPNPKLLFSRNMLKILLNCAPNSKIEELAEVSFKNGISDISYLATTLDSSKKEEGMGMMELLSSISKITKEDFDYSQLSIDERHLITNSLVYSLIQNVFTSDGQNWFDSIDYFWKGEILTISGIHQLGDNFSSFIKILLQKYLMRCGWILSREDFIQINKKTKILDQEDKTATNYELSLKFTPKIES